MSKRSSLAGLADGSSHLKADMSRLSVIAPLQTSVRYTVTLTYLDFAGVRRPLVGVRVWMCDEEPSNQFRMLVELFTNTGGQCDSGNIPNTDPVDGGTLDIFFIFWAWNNVVQVVDPSYNTYIAYTSTYTNHPDGTYGLPVDFGNEAPWLILSFHNGLGAGWDYLNSQLGYQASMVTCVYPDGTLPFYLQLPVGEIHIPNGFGVPQAQIPDALLHEYAHFIMDNLYGFLPATQNPHFLNLVSDATTAWVEGWAEFFPMVVRNDPNSPGVNLETTSWYASGWDEGDTVEGRVAGALWDIFDSQNDVAPYYYDSFSDGLAHIWNIMQTTPCNTFAQFWQAWVNTGYTRAAAVMALFQNTIDYRSPGDSNGNGKVNINDIVIVATHFGYSRTYNPYSPTDPSWDQRADMSRNDVINILDIVLIAVHFGTSYYS